MSHFFDSPRKFVGIGLLFHGLLKITINQDDMRPVVRDLLLFPEGFRDAFSGFFLLVSENEVDIGIGLLFFYFGCVAFSVAFINDENGYKQFCGKNLRVIFLPGFLWFLIYNIIFIHSGEYPYSASRLSLSLISILLGMLSHKIPLLW